MVNELPPLIRRTRGLMSVAFIGIALSLFFHTPTPALLGMAIIGSIALIAGVRYSAWQWLIFYVVICIQVIVVRLLQDNDFAIVQCLALQIAIATAVLRMQGTRPTREGK